LETFGRLFINKISLVIRTKDDDEKMRRIVREVMEKEEGERNRGRSRWQEK
jgi:hypothetical protein